VDGAWSWPFSSNYCRDQAEWSYTSIPPCVFVARWLISTRNNVVLPLLINNKVSFLSSRSDANKSRKYLWFIVRAVNITDTEQDQSRNIMIHPRSSLPCATICIGPCHLKRDYFSGRWRQGCERKLSVCCTYFYLNFLGCAVSIKKVWEVVLGSHGDADIACGLLGCDAIILVVG
jgi:hypothetical protein